MSHPPRNVRTNPLVTFSLLSYSYAQIGLITASICFFVYVEVFSLYGVSLWQLIQNNNEFFNGDRSAGPFVSADGRIYSGAEQEDILRVVQTSWFLTIVCCQAVHVFVVRTATLSIFDHGVLTNTWTNTGVIVAIGIGCFVSFTPLCHQFIRTLAPEIDVVLVGMAVSFAVIWSWTEIRKYIIRAHPLATVSRLLRW